MKTKLVAVLALLTLGAVSATAASLLISGPASPVAVGSTFSIDVKITGAADLAAYQFDVGYDPLRVNGVSVQEGPFLPTAGTTLFNPGAIDDLSGTVSFTAAALTGFGPGANGDGVLVTLRFRGVSAGSADFALLSPVLYDSIPNPIDATVSGASVTIEAGGVPEPASVLLAASSLGLLFLIRRRR